MRHTKFLGVFVISRQICITFTAAMSDRNATNTTAKDWALEHIWLELWVAMMLILAAFGAALNCLLLFIIVSTRKLRTGSGALIAHSIFLETVLCAAALPLFTAAFWTSLYYPPSSTMCRAVFAVVYTFTYASHWATIPVAINRFVAICYPQNYGSFVSRRFLLCAILFSWTIALCCMGGMISDPVSISMTIASGGCVNAPKRPKIYFGLSSIGTTVPAFIEGVIFVSLFTIPWMQKIFNGQGRIAGEPASVTEAANLQKLQAIRARRLRVTQTVFAAYVWSEVCYMLGPIVLTIVSGNKWMMLAVLLFSPALNLLGYSTCPVRV